MQEQQEPAKSSLDLSCTSQIVYGEAYFSRKTSRIREQYGQEKVVVIYCEHLGLEKIKELVCSIGK